VLRRNRDFLLYQAGQLLSSTGSSFSGVAYPLLVLAITGSPAKAGLVSFARLLPAPLLGLAAGVAADRFDRRRIMLAADAGRAVAMGALALVVVVSRAPFWPVPLLAFAEGTGDAFFFACSSAVLRQVVRAEELPAAVALQQGRVATVGVVGPPTGGALFAVARALPFAVDAASYAFSFAAVLAMRTRFQQEREPRTQTVRAELAEGIRFLWTQPFLRVTSFFYAAGNVAIPATLFVVVVVARRQGLSGGEIGLLLALFSAATLTGSALSSLVRRRLSVRAVVLAEAYARLLTFAFVVHPSIYVLVAVVLPQACVLPITDSYVVAHRIAVTPDRLLGRVEAVRMIIARGAAPLGPLLAGILLGAASSRLTVSALLAFTAVVVVATTLARPLRHPPPLVRAG
jgi:hypothetical protein